MTRQRLREITSRYAGLCIGVVGDFCLDRYLEIDPALEEMSIETGLPVHNVVRIRAQPGAAGTIVNNLCALGVGEILPVGFSGEDGEGYELQRALAALPDVSLEYMLQTSERRTFTYCKPLIVEEGKPPRELNRLDSKNWTRTPRALEHNLITAVEEIARHADAIILMDQVDIAETGVVTERVRSSLHGAISLNAELTVLADSRRGLGDYPPFGFKMNLPELAILAGKPALSIEEAKQHASALARRNSQPVFVTLAEHGILAASAEGNCEHVPSFPVRGPIDIVGAGDSVTAGLAAALAAGATLKESMTLAMAAASVVVHQLGTTGTANVEQLSQLFS